MEIKHWFDTREGKLVVGQAAYEQAVELSMPGEILPLVDILTADEFVVDNTFYDKPTVVGTYPEDELRSYGKWVLNILSQGHQTPELKRSHFDRLAKLRLGAGSRAVKKYAFSRFQKSAKKSQIQIFI